MDINPQTGLESGSFSYITRTRLNKLLAEVTKHPLVVVCAGMGYGKTHAVSDFLLESKIPAAWARLSDYGEEDTRSWENLVRPQDRAATNRRFIVVLDDFHLVKDPVVVGFVERGINYAASNGGTVILISRESPRVNLAGLQAKGLVAGVFEEDLNFTENELAQYLSQQGLTVETQSLREIFQDTRGWALAVNFVARSLKRSQLYSGYVRSAMKKNSFQLMEAEVFNVVSERLRHFLVCLSLVDHFSADLAVILAGEDENLLEELKGQNAFIRFDSYINTYLIHHLFLDYLRTKQGILTGKETRETYKAAAGWCNRNGFIVDALTYYEKLGDYESIISIFFELPMQVPHDIALHAALIFERTPPDAFLRVDYLSVMHVRTVMCLGKWREASELLEHYEAQCLDLPGDDAFRNRTLGVIYYCWGILRQLMCTLDDRYDFHLYFAKMYECLTKSPVEPEKLLYHPAGPWVSLIGSHREGAPQEYIDALTSAVQYTSLCLNGAMAGSDDLARGELKFYQGDARAAEPFIVMGLARAREHRQFEAVHRALFYLMQIAVSHGSFTMAEQALKDMEVQLGESEYTVRFFTYDVALGLYYNFLGQPDRIPDWLKGKFVPYSHVYFIENFANQVNAYYCYRTKNYAPLLAYMEEQKRRESSLYGRIELRAMEACVHFKIKDKAAAFSVLGEAYEIASPNSILMPFIWLGKDMRTLTAAALRDAICKVPKPWLEMIGRRSTTQPSAMHSLFPVTKRLMASSVKYLCHPAKAKFCTVCITGFPARK